MEFSLIILITYGCLLATTIIVYCGCIFYREYIRQNPYPHELSDTVSTSSDEELIKQDKVEIKFSGDE